MFRLLHRLFCRGSFHFNQLQFLLTRLDSGQGSLAPSRLDRDLAATMSPSDSLILSARRLWLPDVRSLVTGPRFRQGRPSS
jgi:hypothetical protein